MRFLVPTDVTGWRSAATPTETGELGIVGLMLNVEPKMSAVLRLRRVRKVSLKAEHPSSRPPAVLHHPLPPVSADLGSVLSR